VSTWLVVIKSSIVRTCSATTIFTVDDRSTTDSVDGLVNDVRQ